MFRRRRTSAPDADPAVALGRELLDLAPVWAHYRGAGPTFGGPTRCPCCSSFGMVTGFQAEPTPAALNRCPSCSEEWTITRRALRAASRAGSVDRALREIGIERDTWAGPPVSAQQWAASRAEAPQLVRPMDLGAARGGPHPQVIVASGQPHPPGLFDLPSAPVPPLRLLLVEDDPADAALVEALLEPAGAQVTISQAWTRREGERATGDPAVDLVLLDLGLPDSSGLQTLSQWRPQRDVPLMVLSGNDNAGLRDASYDFGARQFLHKGGLGEWVAAGSAGASRMVHLIRAAASLPA